MALRPTQHVAPELLSKVTKALGITVPDQWYYVFHHTATKAIGKSTLNSYGGSLASFLKSAYPHHQFDEEKLSSKKTLERDQQFLGVIVRQLFPNTEILTKARKVVGVVNPETNEYLEIDFWLPSLKLGIEYQDKHHFGYQWYANESLEAYQKRDAIKKATMPTLGYTLVTIGYWWDKSIESVAATIRKFRPDLLPQYESVLAAPIPSDPPTGSVNSGSAIPGVAGIMSPFVPKANFNPANWYAGEKHDGIRGFYNPGLKQMFSRAGKELSLFTPLLSDIPGMLVEGEITAGRGNYNKTTVVSNHTQHDKVNWPMLRYIVFDIPDAELGDYTTRYSSITSALYARPFVFAQPAFRILLKDKDHLKQLVDDIILDIGEGVIAQQDTLYQYGRASGLAKIKVRRDADAQILRVTKHFCLCKLVSGVIAEIVFSGDFDSNELKPGDIVSYFHNGYSQNGMPKQGEIYKVRYDLTWAQLTGDENTAKRPSKEVVGGSSLIAKNTERLKRGHWNKSLNVREFFDTFAHKSGFDPLVPENWYPVRRSALERNIGGAGLVNAYGFSIVKALSRAYPEVKFNSAKFRVRAKTRAKRGYWNNIPNVRAFLDDFARKAGFDPLMPENWYPVRQTALLRAAGVGVLNAHDYSLKTVIARAYPELKFIEDRFRIRDKPRVRRGHWTKSQNVRAYFDKLARTYGFDPLVPDNWRNVNKTMQKNVGGAGILKTHGYSLKKALTHAYPELEFDKMRTRAKKGHWDTPSNVRAFFDEFARNTGFDPLLPKNWYAVTTKAVHRAGGGSILSKLGSFTSALTCAYPELNWK